MKKMSIVINGQHEEEIGLEILQGIYAAIQNHGYTDVSVQAETVNQRKEIEIPAFLTGYARGAAATVGSERRKVIEPLPENVRLKHEVIRKPYTSSTKVSETSYEYVIKLEENELIGVEISEMALIDEDGDVAAFSNFLAKGKDETEVTFTIEDNY